MNRLRTCRYETKWYDVFFIIIVTPTTHAKQMFAQNCINSYQEATYQFRLGRDLLLIYIQYVMVINRTLKTVLLNYSRQSRLPNFFPRLVVFSCPKLSIL